MSVLNREQFTATLQARVGTDTSDEGLKFVEDMMDTFNEMESKFTGQSEEVWQKKLTDLDNEWRTKFQQRFFNSASTTPGDVKEDQEDDVRDDGKLVTFDDLFTEREG